jgi:hypothetical protein
MPSFSVKQKPNWYAPGDISATERGWELTATGEVLVAQRNLLAKQADAQGAPTFTAAVTYSATSTMITGDVMTITLTASEAVRVDAGSYINVTMGAFTRKAIVNRTTSTATSLKFDYVVVAEDDAAATEVVVATTVVGKVSDVVGDNLVNATVTFVAPNTSAATAN